MHASGMGFRAIERVKGVHHTTIIYWVKQYGKQWLESQQLLEAPVGEAIPEGVENSMN